MPHQCTGCGHTFEDGSKEMLSGCPECGGNKFQFRPEGAPLPDDPDPPGDVADETAPPDPEDRSPVADTGSVAETVGRATTKVRDFVATTPDPAGAEAANRPDPDRSWPGEADAEATTDADSEATSEPTSDTDAAAAPDPQTGSDGEIIDADAREDERDSPGEDEDVAQASARSDVVTNDELDDVSRRRETRDATAYQTSDAPSSGSGPANSTEAGAAGTVEPDVDDQAEVVDKPNGDDPDLSELREQLNDQFESIKIVEPGQYELNLMELYDREEYIIALQENGRYVIQVPDQWIGDDLDDR